MVIPKRGDVFWISLDPTLGTEIQKARPCLVVSNDQANQRYQQVTVVPLTSQRTERIEPFQALIPQEALGVGKNAKALAEQIRAVSKLRLGKFVGHVPLTILRRVEDALRVHLGL